MHLLHDNQLPPAN